LGRQRQEAGRRLYRAPGVLPPSYLLTKANPSKDGGAKLRDYSPYLTSSERTKSVGLPEAIASAARFVFEPHFQLGELTMKENYGVIWV